MFKNEEKYLEKYVEKNRAVSRQCKTMGKPCKLRCFWFSRLPILPYFR